MYKEIEHDCEDIEHDCCFTQDGWSKTIQLETGLELEIKQLTSGIGNSYILTIKSDKEYKKVGSVCIDDDNELCVMRE